MCAEGPVCADGPADAPETRGSNPDDGGFLGAGGGLAGGRGARGSAGGRCGLGKAREDPGDGGVGCDDDVGGGGDMAGRLPSSGHAFKTNFAVEPSEGGVQVPAQVAGFDALRDLVWEWCNLLASPRIREDLADAAAAGPRSGFRV